MGKSALACNTVEMMQQECLYIDCRYISDVNELTKFRGVLLLDNVDRLIQQQEFF